MKFVTSTGTGLYYRLEGNPDLPLVALSHSLGGDHGHWDRQIPDFLGHFRVLRYDTLGHGASDVPSREYTMEQLASHVLELTASLGISRFALCGLSLGGMIGQWIAINSPQSLNALILANTSPKMPPKSLWDERRKIAFEQGMKALVDGSMGRFFSARLIEANEPYCSTSRVTFLTTDPAGYAGCCSAIRDMDHIPSLPKIKTPSLIIASEEDPSTPWTGHGEILARDIPGAKVVKLAGKHISAIEQPEAFNAAAIEFLRAHTGGNGKRLS